MIDSPEVIALREALLDAQYELRRNPTFAVLVIVTGVPAAGRSETVNQLKTTLDPKSIDIRAFDEGDGGRPPMWRYWMELPRRGRITIFFSGWYGDYLQRQWRSRKKDRELARHQRQIRKTELTLANNGVRLLKVHLEVSRGLQKLRLARLCADKLTRWRVSAEDLREAKHYGAVRRAMHKVLSTTDQPHARWHIVDGADEARRLLQVGRLLVDEIKAGLAKPRGVEREAWPKKPARQKSVFPTAVRGKPLDHEAYRLELEKLQGRFARLTRRKRFRKRGLVLAFEGMDAAGKGGAIERLTAALDAREYRVVPIAAPTPEDLSYPYLWRFWKPLQAHGEVTVFDRTWYGRVLVERVRALTPTAEWRRGYEEIREFEWQLADSGYIVQKFWLSLGFEEQLKRFKERDANPLKRFKVDPQDWVNRRYYGAYQTAAQEMIRRTDVDFAPWTIVEADDKYAARLKVMRTVVERLEDG